MPVVINGTTGITNVDGSAAAPAATGMTSATTGLYYGTNTVGLATNGTNALFVDASQNVGIGTSSPTNRLTAVNTSITGGAPLTSGSSADPNAIARFQIGAVAVDLGAYVSGTVWLQPRLASDYSSNFSMALQPNGGNVGIGTSSPAYKFDVQGGRSVLSANSEAFALGLRYNTSTNGVWLGSPSANAFQISSFGGGAYLNIDSSGNLLVGTTSGSFHRFLKASASDFAVQSANTSATTPYGHVITFTAVAPNDTTSMFLRCDDTGQTGRIQLRSNGGIANFQANNVNLSDRREKTNFAPAKSYLDAICAIPVQTFNYVDQNLKDDPGLTLGVVAQDVQTVAPELVHESNWGTEDNPKMRLSIYQTDLQYALMKCIQELKTQNDDLRARVAALEGAA